MKKIQLLGLVTLLVSGVVQAEAPCNGFEIVIKNNLPVKLLATTVKLKGAHILPGLTEINSKSEQIFLVSDSDADRPMTGEFIFKTISLPSKNIHVEFDLTNQLLVCAHSDKNIPNEYPVTNTRLPSQIVYNIG